MQLAVYYVMTEPGVSLDHLKDEDARNIKFVKDGFSWWAMLFPLLWSLYNRMWLVFLGYLAAIIALVFIAEAFGSTTGGFITVLATLFFAMEAGFLKSWSLRRKTGRLSGLSLPPIWMRQKFVSSTAFPKPKVKCGFHRGQWLHKPATLTSLE